jgi:lipoprotein-anchoring transpeptidase ErfK/SrfK
MRVSGHRISISDTATGRFWKVAVLTAAGTIGATSQSEAALYYWQDSDPGYYRPVQPAPQRKRVRKATDKKKIEKTEKETSAKPIGPLIIAISIEKQRVRVYDANGFFAESPVSTGTKSHPTPMGVFSIIQKHRMHHSNIYSGAPMPYMQRITWSGVAMHQGVLPGYPASHGCIRMPMAFAVKMWNWTRMGARVIVTPGDITPSAFSHPLLATQKVVPVAGDMPQVDAPVGVKSDKGADAQPATKASDSADARLELRSTVGHALTQTADASGSMPARAAVTMSDASPAAASRDAKTAATAAKPETAKAETDQAAAKSVDTAPSEEKPAEATAADHSTAKVEVSAKPEEKAPESKTETASEAKAEAKVETTAAVAKPDTTKPETAKVEPAKADESKTADKPAETKPAETKAADAPADVKKDPSRLPGVAKIELKRDGQVAVLISRKDGKLYVRQNFKPVFEVPVTIAPSERLLGTHVFTAEVDKNDANALRWSVVSMPVTARNAQKNEEDERASRRRKGAAAPAEAKPVPAPNTPAEALDRITVPADAMARIAEVLTSGSSIMVSDQSINAGGETGEGTEFIVRLR